MFIQLSTKLQLPNHHDHNNNILYPHNLCSQYLKVRYKLTLIHYMPSSGSISLTRTKKRRKDIALFVTRKILCLKRPKLTERLGWVQLLKIWPPHVKEPREEEEWSEGEWQVIEMLPHQKILPDPLIFTSFHGSGEKFPFPFSLATIVQGVQEKLCFFPGIFSILPPTPRQGRSDSLVTSTGT